MRLRSSSEVQDGEDPTRIFAPECSKDTLNRIESTFETIRGKIKGNTAEAFEPKK